MSYEYYDKAYKLGKKSYQANLAKGLRPTLAILDDILPPKGEYSEVSLGLIQIPTELIVGTKTAGRSNSFAANFMPILSPNSEFAAKWNSVSLSHVKEGIREPIVAYEYMNKFYILEGNKRVSVMKFFDVAAIPGNVTRIIPKRNNNPENELYYEFLDFYEVSQVNYIWFSNLGSFAKLQKSVGKDPGEVWTHDDKLTFSSIYYRFLAEYTACGGNSLNITPGDAFLAFINIYPYKDVLEMTTAQLKEQMLKSWEEFRLLQTNQEIELKMNPSSERKSILSKILPLSTPKQKIAFIYEKSAYTSSWTYAHELGRHHIDSTFSNEIETLYYDNITEETIEDALQLAIQKGCNLIFTTSPTFSTASVRCAIENPKVRILNCSLNISHRYIRTYYARMYEAKYLMGAIAGALADNNELMYIGDYPIYGTIASINAFALGAKLVNPRAKIYLEWSCVKDNDVKAKVHHTSASFISGRDITTPAEPSRYFGLFGIQDDEPYNVAMPVCHWGKFYEQLIRTIMNGSWNQEDDTEGVKSINYWWGMSSDVVDVICSKRLPLSTQKLVSLLKKSIISGNISPFYGIIYDQDGIQRNKDKFQMTPEEIMGMDWLMDNIIGHIPSMDELTEEGRLVVEQQGVAQTERI